MIYPQMSQIICHEFSRISTKKKWGTEGTERGVFDHEGHEGKIEKGLAVCGPLRGSRKATPCGSKLAVPFRSKLLRAQPVLIRRLRRLAKLGLGDCDYCYGGEGHEDFGGAARGGWGAVFVQPCLGDLAGSPVCSVFWRFSIN